MVEREPILHQGRGRGGRGANTALPKPAPVPRPGNIALDIERPLFDAGPNWDFHAYKESLLSKQDVHETLPTLQFFDGKA